MASHRVPYNPRMVYWTWWSPVKRLAALPGESPKVALNIDYNLIFLFHATPSGTEGAVVYNPPISFFADTLNQEIAICRSRGQKIILTVGGANAAVSIDTPTRAANFVASIKAINVQLGGSGTTNVIDGIDFNNYETIISANQATYMGDAALALRAYYGDDFIFTSPPAVFGRTAGGQAWNDRWLLARLYSRDAIDLFSPQYYDGPGNPLVSTINTVADFYHVQIRLEDGAVYAGSGTPVQIPFDRIAIGFGIKPGDANWWASATAVKNAYLDSGVQSRTPKGAFNFSLEQDPTEQFIAVAGPSIINNAEPSPHFTLAASPNFTDGTNTTAQLAAPAGKSGADFQAGELCESSNPVPSIDLGSGKYTEVEWCFQATAAAEDGAQYEFRVTNAGIELDTYTVTPKLSIGTPPPTPSPGADPSVTLTGVASLTGVSSITG